MPTRALKGCPRCTTIYSGRRYEETRNPQSHVVIEFDTATWKSRRKIDVAPLGGSPSDQQGFACELETTLVQRPCRCQLP